MLSCLLLPVPVFLCFLSSLWAWVVLWLVVCCVVSSLVVLSCVVLLSCDVLCFLWSWLLSPLLCPCLPLPPAMFLSVRAFWMLFLLLSLLVLSCVCWSGLLPWVVFCLLLGCVCSSLAGLLVGSLLSSCVTSWFCCFRVSCSPLPGAYFQVELFTARLLGLVWWGVGLVRLGAPCVLSCLVLSFGWALLCLVVGCFLLCPGSAVLCLVWPSPPLFLVPGRWPLLRCCCICVAAGLLAGAALLAFDFVAGGEKI